MPRPAALLGRVPAGVRTGGTSVGPASGARTTGVRWSAGLDDELGAPSEPGKASPADVGEPAAEARRLRHDRILLEQQLRARRARPQPGAGAFRHAVAPRYRIDVLPSSVGDCCTIRLVGEVDAAAVARIRGLLRGRAADRGCDLTVDLTGVTFLDVVALNLLVELRAITHSRHARFALLGVHGQPQRLITRAQTLGITPPLRLD